MLVEEVDVVGAEPLERAVDRAPHVLGRAVERADGRHVTGRRVVHAARELGCDHVLVAVALDRPADEHLVGQRAVELRGVEEVHAEPQRPLDRRCGLVLVGGPVEGRHSHAAEPDRRYLQVCELALFHLLPSLSRGGWPSRPSVYPAWRGRLHLQQMRTRSDVSLVR